MTVSHRWMFAGNTARHLSATPSPFSAQRMKSGSLRPPMRSNRYESALSRLRIPTAVKKIRACAMCSRMASSCSGTIEPERVHRPDRQRHDLLSGHVGGVFMAPLDVRDQVRLGLGIHERQRVFVLEFRPEEAERKRAGAEDDDAVSQFKVLPQ